MDLSRQPDPKKGVQNYQGPTNGRENAIPKIHKFIIHGNKVAHTKVQYLPIHREAK